MTAKEFVDAIQRREFRGPFKSRGPDYRVAIDADGKVVAEFKSSELCQRFARATAAEIRRRMKAGEKYRGL